jgi:acid stress-induced BolA-like protein IbaG/YrbA
MFGSVSDHFTNLRHVKRWKTCVSGLNALFRGTKLAKHPFYSIETKMMFGSVSEHFDNLRHVKRCKTCVSSLNALLWGTKLAKDPFYSIGTKMMFGSVLEHFANLRHVKRCKTCVRTRMHYFRVLKLWNLHSSLLDPKWCLGVFQSNSLTFNM